MAEAGKTSGYEPRNPRSFVLGMCFCLGVALGIGMFHPSSPGFFPVEEQPSPPGKGPGDSSPPTEIGGDPHIEPIPPIPPSREKPGFVEMSLEPPAVLLSRNGDLPAGALADGTGSARNSAAAGTPATRRTHPAE